MRGNDLLITNIGWLGTMDGENRLLRDGYILIEGGFIRTLGTGEVPEWDGPVLDAEGGIALPGLINLHHHLYQNLARAYSPVCNHSLLPWVREMNKLWDGFTVEDLIVATRTGLVELMLSGCTTVLDHHYVFPQGGGDMIAGQFAVAGELGIRFVAGRGSFDTGDNLMPPWAVDSTDRILEDCERLIQTYHDLEPGSYRQIALAPTGPLVVSPRLLKESAAMAIRHQAVITTHNCESADELPWAMEKVGCTPFEHLLNCGWGDGRTVLAHSIQMDDKAVALAGKHRMGVAHCPSSNMRLGSGICRVQDLRNAGAHVGLGVDGSASNDSGHLLNEAHQCLYLSRVRYGASSMTIEDALSIATISGARALGRESDLGSLEPGKCGDVAIFPRQDLWSAGAENPFDALLFCFPRLVNHLVVGGRVVVEGGQLPGIDIPLLIENHTRCANKFR